MRKLLRRLPRPVRDRLRAALKRYRRARYRAREGLRPVVVQRQEIAAALRETGISEGDTVFVQASMAALGTIDGGPAEAIAALRDVVGEEGLITMPAFPLTGPSVEHLRRQPVFDSRSDPSRMGAISEAFRVAPGTVRSLHPTHSVTAAGPGARELVAGHDRALNPFGEETPFARLHERGAWQVFFGSGTRPLTMYHCFEALREPPFPFETFLPDPVEVTCIDCDGREIEVRTLVHYPRLGLGRIDVDSRLEGDVRKRLTETGLRSARLGRGEILAQPLPELFEGLERMLGDGVTIYDPRQLQDLKR